MLLIVIQISKEPRLSTLENNCPSLWHVPSLPCPTEFYILHSPYFKIKPFKISTFKTSDYFQQFLRSQIKFYSYKLGYIIMMDLTWNIRKKTTYLVSPLSFFSPLAFQYPAHQWATYHINRNKHISIGNRNVTILYFAREWP